MSGRYDEAGAVTLTLRQRMTRVFLSSRFNVRSLFLGSNGDRIEYPPPRRTAMGERDRRPGTYASWELGTSFSSDNSWNGCGYPRLDSSRRTPQDVEDSRVH